MAHANENLFNYVPPPRPSAVRGVTRLAQQYLKSTLNQFNVHVLN